MLCLNVLRRTKMQFPRLPLFKSRIMPLFAAAWMMVGLPPVFSPDTAQANGFRPSGVRVMHAAPAPMQPRHHMRHPVQRHAPPAWNHHTRQHVGHPQRHGFHPHMGRPHTGYVHMGYVQHHRPVIHRPFHPQWQPHIPAYFHPATQQNHYGLGGCCKPNVVVHPITFPPNMGHNGHHTPHIPKVDIPSPKIHRPFS